MPNQHPTDNTELVRHFLASLARVDIAAVGDLVTDDLTFRVPGSLPISGLYEGKQTFINEFLGGVAALFETGSLAFDIKHIHTTTTDTVIAEYTGTGISATTAKRYLNEYCVVYGIRDGKISTVREYLDTAHVADVLLSVDVK